MAQGFIQTMLLLLTAFCAFGDSQRAIFKVRKIELLKVRPKGSEKGVEYVDLDSILHSKTGACIANGDGAMDELAWALEHKRKETYGLFAHASFVGKCPPKD